MKNGEKQARVVIIGGGFAGIEVALKLANDPSAQVTLVSTNSSFQYYPSLYRLVVGASSNQVSVPLATILPKNVTLVIDSYVGMDLAQKTISLKSGAAVSYDYAVMAMGSEPNYFGIDGMEVHSKSFLSVEKALALKSYLLKNIQDAKGLSEEAAKAKLRTVIVGAGPSGTELAGALRPFLVAEAKKAGINPDFIGVDLLDSAPRVLPVLPESASALVTEQLKKNGVTVYTNYGVNACDDDCITVTNKNGAMEETIKMHTATVIWTAGTKISSAFATIPGVVMTEKKRVQVTPTLTLPNDDSVYIAGDGSATPYSGLAQTAADQGKYVADAIARKIHGQAAISYVPKQGIFVIPVGTFWGILNKKNFVVSGLPAYVIRVLADMRYFLSITSLGHVISMIKNKNS